MPISTMILSSNMRASSKITACNFVVTQSLSFKLSCMLRKRKQRLDLLGGCFRLIYQHLVNSNFNMECSYISRC